MLVCSGLAIAFCVVSYGTSVVAAIAMDDGSGGAVLSLQPSQPSGGGDLGGVDCPEHCR